MAFAMGILACLNTVLPGGCSRSPSPGAPVPGGGAHKIIQIWILDKENKTLLEEKNRTALRVGDQLPLQVMASWAIPYVGEVTDKARLTVNDPTLGELDSKGVFTAKRPGQIAIEAVVRVVRSSGEDQLLDPTDQAPAGTPITEFRSQIELTITN